MSISVRNVTKVFGKQKALDDVSFDIGKGEIVGFLGPNGAGKSTLMKIITGYIPPTAGDIFVNDINIFDDPIKIRRSLGYLPEQNPLYANMYIVEYLNFVAGIYKVPNRRERIADVISLTGLQPEITKKIGNLSKGFKQRVGLAQTILHNPDTLILDEPTSGLDPNQLVEIRTLIHNLGKEKTVMLSTHIMQEVEAICDRIIIINKGVLVADKNAKDIRLGDKNSMTLIMEFRQRIDSQALSRINGVAKVVHLNDNNYIIECNSGSDIRQDIFAFAVKTGNAVLNMQTQEKSLETVFGELTNRV